MRGYGLLFGLNYDYAPTARLNGCINDVMNIKTYLTSQGIPCDVYTDDVSREDTSGRGMIRRLNEAAVKSYRDNLDMIWIHYSGHGSYMRDTTGDEKDGKDECIVPSDFATAGLIKDDYLNALFAQFNPATKVICVFDCCHSGTIGDVKYSWEGPTKVLVENINCKASCKIITISGCLDNQVSMDAYNITGDNKYTGALTSCLLSALKTNPSLKSNVFQLIECTRSILSQGGFQQIAKLCSSYNLTKDPVLIVKMA